MFSITKMLANMAYCDGNLHEQAVNNTALAAMNLYSHMTQVCQTSHKKIKVGSTELAAVANNINILFTQVQCSKNVKHITEQLFMHLRKNGQHWMAT